MRKWSDLKTNKKPKRLFYTVLLFLKKWIWGSYKGGGINGLWHWIRCHTYNRYHVINISGEDGYDYGFIDADYTLLLANFKILKDFVELEDPTVGLRTLESYGHEDNCDMLEHLKAQLEREAEVRAIYTWWTEIRPKEHAECDKMLFSNPIEFTENEDGNLTFSEESTKHNRDWYNKTEELAAKDTEMLSRLINIRRCLWT